MNLVGVANIFTPKRMSCFYTCEQQMLIRKNVHFNSKHSCICICKSELLTGLHEGDKQETQNKLTSLNQAANFSSRHSPGTAGL